MEGRIRQLEAMLENAEIIAPPEPGVVGPGTIVTIVYEGDSDDDAERYLVGHIEERTGELDVISPTAPLGAALLGARAGDTVAYEAPERRAARARSSGWKRSDRAGRRTRGARAARRRSRRGRRPAAAARPRHRAARRHGPPPRAAGPAGGAGRRAAPRLDGDRRPQLLPCYDAPGRALPRAGVRPSWPRAGDPRPPPVPARGLCRRRRGDGRPGRRGSTADRRRLLDGRDDRPAAVAAPPRPGAWPRARRHGGPLQHAPQRAPVVPRPHRAGRPGPADAGAGAALADAQLYLQRKTSTWSPWAVEQAAQHDWRMVLEAGRALGAFRSDEWLGEIDVPTAVIVTMADEVVPVRRQIQLFEGIPTARALARRRRPRRRGRPPRALRAGAAAGPCDDVATRAVAERR